MIDEWKKLTLNQVAAISTILVITGACLWYFFNGVALFAGGAIVAVALYNEMARPKNKE